MFDSLNRHMLPPYGCDWVHAPNFQRLAKQTVTFDTSYVCSMPCMPARRDMHTCRPGFLHRSWGPLEPYDDSVPQMLKNAGVYTHLVTDHYHYFEEGGSNYHTKFNTWEFFRGQEGDPWMGLVKEPKLPDPITGRHEDTYPFVRQDFRNRGGMPTADLHMQTKTFEAGVDFINRNEDADNWYLQIETFDPHEPYFSYKKYKDLYVEHYDSYKGPHFDWPHYNFVENSREEINHLVHENAALISMCDEKLGTVLDLMDEKNLWKDTLLVVCTDHGFLLGEHDRTGKCWCPFYEEIARTPLFIWDPRQGLRDERRQALVQPAIDLGPTLLNYFGLSPTPDMLGKDLGPVLADDTPVRDYAIFGMHGHHVTITDGRYVYMRGPDGGKNHLLYEYTLMPNHMRDSFSVEELQKSEGLVKPFPFHKGLRSQKIPAKGGLPGKEQPPMQLDTLLFDLENDPKQLNPLQDPSLEETFKEELKKLMKACDAPPEQFERLGLGAPG